MLGDFEWQTNIFLKLAQFKQYVYLYYQIVMKKIIKFQEFPLISLMASFILFLFIFILA